MGNDFQQGFRRLLEAAEGLPEVTPATSYGRPSLKLRKKFLACMKDQDTAVLMCPLEEKDMLIAAAPDIYFETDHYRGWPAILVRMQAVSDGELRHRVVLAWRMQAPKRLAAALNVPPSGQS